MGVPPGARENDVDHYDPPPVPFSKRFKAAIVGSLGTSVAAVALLGVLWYVGLRNPTLRPAYGWTTGALLTICTLWIIARIVSELGVLELLSFLAQPWLWFVSDDLDGPVKWLWAIALIAWIARYAFVFL